MENRDKKLVNNFMRLHEEMSRNKPRKVEQMVSWTELAIVYLTCLIAATLGYLAAEALYNFHIIGG